MVKQSGTLVIVPCGKAKIWDKQPNAGPTPAGQTYIGSPFKVNRQYAKRFGDAWVVLSAKYGFLRPTDAIEGPYNVTFKRSDPQSIPVETLRQQVRARHLDGYGRVIGLGGKEYRERITEAFAGTGLQPLFPFAGLPLGLSLAAAKQAVRLAGPSH